MSEEKVVLASAISGREVRQRRGSPPAIPSSPINQAKFKISQQEVRLDLPKEDLDRSAVSQLWLRSRLLTAAETAIPSPDKQGSRSGIYRPRGEDRPLNLPNIALAFRLVTFLWADFLELFWQDHRWRLSAFLCRRLVKGVLPASRLWAQSRMLDVVQQSFESRDVDRIEVLRVAGLSLLLQASDDIYNFFSKHNDELIRLDINYNTEKAYFRSQLSLSIPSMSSPYLSALIYEAGVFAGFEHRTDRYGRRTTFGGPFGTLKSTFTLITITVEVVTQVYLLLRTLASTGSSQFNANSAVLISLALAPSLLRLVGTWIFSHTSTMRRRLDWRFERMEERDIKDMGRKGDFKQEVVLFGLKDWVLNKWDTLKVAQMKEQEQVKEHITAVELGLGLGQQGVETAFYVLLALRTLSTTLSLGSIRLYQSTASSLLSSVRSFTHTLESSFQSIFYLAAFCEATAQPEIKELNYRLGRDPDVKLVDYKAVRKEGGMAIEARGLAFSYPGSSKPVLRDINLTLKPGETLAIVGYNGGGKTTLVKALMGLYDHSGTLLINGLPAEDFVPDSLHKRTSCLFQDFSKYSLTLRENVGIGAVKRLTDTDAINLAIERGGAEKVLEKIGMEGKLNRSGVPDAAEGEGGGDTSVSQQEPEAEGPPPPPPNGIGRGGLEPPGGRGGGGMLGEGPGGSGRGLGRDGGPPPGMPPPPDRMPPAISSRPVDIWNSYGDKRAALSGGQWQRVALARAFLRADEADLVVFDEPSASLDPRAEAQLFQRIHALSTQGGRRTTTIYISHRFSTVRKADQIAVVEEGTIAEIGSHAELMRLQGRYFELFNLQKEGFEE